MDYTNVTFNFFHALNCYKGQVLLPLQIISLAIKYRVILMSCQICTSFSNLRPTPIDPLHVSSKKSTSSVLQRVTCGRRLPKSTIMGNYVSSFANYLLSFRVKITHYWKLPIYIFFPSVVPSIKSSSSPGHECDSSKVCHKNAIKNSTLRWNTTQAHTRNMAAHVLEYTVIYQVSRWVKYFPFWKRNYKPSELQVLYTNFSIMTVGRLSSPQLHMNESY
jgi:hypothetical protein